MKYSDFVNLLYNKREESFASFQSRLIPTQQKIIGVRTPIMRKMAKEYAKDRDSILAFPDDFFEVTFIKLAIVSAQPYEFFKKTVEDCVKRIDNWATCDCFKVKCIKNHKQDFLETLKKIFLHGGEFYERYVLVTLLNYYVEDGFLTLIEEFLIKADTTLYYVHMAVAWLTAEICVKNYGYGLSILQKELLDKKTHNKAIQKAIESYRLTAEQKAQLRAFKR